jgi:hypothetical protein
MTWLAWRQFRIPAAVSVVLLAVLAVVLAVTHNQVEHQQHLFKLLGTMQNAVPGLIGVFWGAPLIAREIETGNHRLAWTQSVTRTRWLAVTTAVSGLAGMIVAGLFSLMVTWWARPVDQMHMDRFATAIFGERGVAPIGYAAFAFALGVTFGLVIRRTLPAMAATLVGYIAIRELMTYKVRPHLLRAAHLNLPLDPATLSFGFIQPQHAPPIASVTSTSANLPGALVFSSRIADNAGHAPTSRVLLNACHNQLQGAGAHGLQSCVAMLSVNYHEVVSYLPASSYWNLQWHEAGAYFGLALILIGFCFWWIRSVS